MAGDETLEVTWYGQAMFTVAGGGVTIAVDPVPPETGYRYDPVRADVILITHSHYDHSYTRGVSGNPKLVNTSGTHDFDGLTIQGFDAFHDSRKGKERGPNIMYSWEQAGFKIAHLGDLGHQLAPDVTEHLKGMDVLMMPVGGVFTIDGAGAVKLAGALAPAVIFPMHYLTPDVSIPLQSLGEFTNMFRGTVREIDDRPLLISPDMIPRSTEVWVLPYI